MIRKKNSFKSNQGKLKDNKTFRLILTSIICVILLVTIVPRGKTIWELSARKQELETKKAKLIQINEEKQKQLKDADSPEAMERIAREQLGMVKKGERLIIQVIHDK